MTGKELEIDKRDTEIFAYSLLERCRDWNVGLQMWLLLRLMVGVVERLAQGNVKQCEQRKLLYALGVVVVV